MVGTTGQTALDHLATSVAVDFVIIDVVLPGSLQGADFQQALGKTRPRGLVLLMTGYAREVLIENPIASKPCGDFKLLSKPIAFQDDAAAIRQALNEDIYRDHSSAKKVKVELFIHWRPWVIFFAVLFLCRLI